MPGTEQIESVVRRLAPDVVRVVLRDAPDWSGDPAIYVRVLLADEATTGGRLGEVVSRVRETISEELGLDRLDRIPYFKFRSVSEQAKLREASWE
jgi:hypothetical protein